MLGRKIKTYLIEGFVDFKYASRPEIRNHAMLMQDIRTHVDVLERVHRTDSKLSRLLKRLVTPSVFAAARRLCERNSPDRDTGTPLDALNTYDAAFHGAG